MPADPISNPISKPDTADIDLLATLSERDSNPNPTSELSPTRRHWPADPISNPISNPISKPDTADIDLLATLSEREVVEGLAEAIKMGCIRDEALFDFMEDNVDGVKALERGPIERVIYDGVR